MKQGEKMYKAIKEIGGYKIGDKIPAEKALIWIKMYAEPHVELVSDNNVNQVEVSKEVEVPKESEDSSDSILDDYLARSANVVKSNVLNDKLNKNQLEKLLKLEKSNKNRSNVIFAIKKRISK